MAVIHGGLIVYSNDGVNQLYSGGYYGSGTVTVTETGLTNNDGSNYIYSGNKNFIGVSTTENATTPEFKIGDTITLTTMDAILYIVEEQPKEYTLRIDGVEVTDYDNVIVNGVSYKCKKGVSVPTDLTGYIVSVPSGWSATAGYGNFNIEGLVSYGSMNVGVNSYPGGFRIGFSGGDDGFGDWRYVQKQNSIGVPYSSDITPSQSFILNVTGGYDVTNQSLIQWFVNNNATFTKVEEVVLINFHISGMRFSAEEGMTWSEWVNSSYNTMGFLIVGNGLISNGAATIAGVVNTDVIIENKEYTFDTSGFE